MEDPRQRRFFHTSDLTELFNLNDPFDGEAESDQLFKQYKLAPSNIQKKNNKPEGNFSFSKIEKMRKLASALSKKVVQKVENNKARSKIKSQKEPQENNKKENGKKNSTEIQDQISTDRNSISIQENVSNFSNPDYENPAVSLINESTNNSESLNQPEYSLSEDKIEKSVSKSEISRSSEEEGEIRESDSNLEKSPKKSKQESKMQNEDKEERRKRKRKKKKRSSRDEVSAIFEGEKVPCLIGRRLGFSKEQESGSTEDDEYVLNKLFAKAGEYFLNYQYFFIIIIEN